MKLSEWAKSQGISYKTAWRWFKSGKLPVRAEQTATGTILVKTFDGNNDLSCVVYARVGLKDQKSDLDRQVARVVEAVTGQGFTVSKIVTEMGVGLNGPRPKLRQLLSDSSIKRIAVEHKDRVMRFGYEYVESALLAQGRSLIVVDEGELKDDLVEDMVAVLTSFCARLYGKRGTKNKAQRVLEALKSNCSTHH